MNHEDMEKIIISTFKDMIQMAKEPNSEDVWPKLIWPKYSPLKKYSNNDNKDKRFSEQEVKQKFIDNLRNSRKKVYYSVETPTVDDYYFSSDIPICVRQQKKFEELKRNFISLDSSGQSGNFDLTIYDSNHVIQHHIEFKSGNPDAKEITKDLLKLANEPWCEYCRMELKEKSVDGKYNGKKEHYFIHIIDRCNEDTKKALRDKFLCVPHTAKEKEIEIENMGYLEDLKASIKELIRESMNTIYVYVLNLVKGKEGYYYFVYNKVIEDGRIDWDSCWYKYDGEEFKNKDAKDFVEQ